MTLFNVLRVFILFLPFQFALNISQGVDLAIARIIILILFVAIVLRSLVKKSIFIPINLQSICLIMFLAINAFSLFFSDNLEFGLRKILFLISIIPLYFVARYFLVESPNSKSLILDSVVVGGLLSLIAGVLIFFGQFVFNIDSVLGFYDLVGPLFWGNSFAESVLNNQSFLVNIGGVDYLRMAALFPDPHNFALYSGVVALLAIPVFYSHKNKDRRWLYGVTACFGVLGVALSFSRAAYLAIGFAVIVMLVTYFVGPDKKRYNVNIFNILMVVILAVAVLLSPAKNRFLDIFSTKDGSNIGRIEILRQGRDIFIENYLSGVGVGNAPLYFNEDIEYRNPTNSHNTYLEIAIENGVLGLMIWLLLILGTIIQLIKFVRNQINLPDRMYAIGVLGAMSFFAVHSFFEVFLYSPVNLAILMILLALSSRATSKIKN